MALLQILKKMRISSIPPSGACPKYFTFSVFIIHINFVVGAKEIFNKLFKASLISIPYVLSGMHVYNTDQITDKRQYRKQQKINIFRQKC